MKDERKDALAKAIADLKQRGASSGPPQDVVNETLAQLAQAQHQAPSRPTISEAPKPKTLLLGSVARVAAAAVVLIAAGYTFGRISAPQPNFDELEAAMIPSLRASLEPSIRDSIAREISQEYERAMVAGYVRLRDELTEQYRSDMVITAAQTLAASNTTTNELVTQLAELFAASRLQDQERIAAAFEQIETQDAEEKAHLTSAIVSLASQTDVEFKRTQDAIRQLANARDDTTIPYRDSSETIN